MMSSMQKKSKDCKSKPRWLQIQVTWGKATPRTAYNHQIFSSINKYGDMESVEIFCRYKYITMSCRKQEDKSMLKQTTDYKAFFSH